MFWITDNGSSHRGRLGQADDPASPNAHLIHLPVHASWLDQIRDRLAAFEIRYNAIARPFSWKFTRTDLNDLLHRIDAHDKTQPHALQPDLNPR